jgi:hypothetical protein
MYCDAFKRTNTGMLSPVEFETTLQELDQAAA